jgi:predicted P-loop ATPase
MINITPQQLRKAADIQERIQSLQKELGQLLDASGPAETATTEAPKRRKFSAAARAKMRAAQKARWAKIKGTAPEAKPAKKPKRKMSAQGIANIRPGVAKRMAAQGKVVQKPKRKFSAAGRAALSAAAKARWAKAKKGGKTSL